MSRQPLTSLPFPDKVAIIYLVQKPTWDSFKGLLNRKPAHRFTDELLKA